MAPPAPFPGHGGLLAALLVCPSALLAQPAEPVPEPRDTFARATAYAVPLQDIVIDGRTDDWPDTMVRYPVLNNYYVYGPTDIDRLDLTDNPDFAAAFMVGYDPAEEFVYVAIVVRDDDHVVSQGSSRTDGAEVYLQGLRDRSSEPAAFPETLTQYVGIAGEGLYDSPDNPTLNGGSFALTGSSFAWTREGDVTTYEFALRAYDRYPHAPTRLEGGLRMGFEVVVAEKDDPPESRLAFMAWGPVGAYKFTRGSLLGELVLLEEDRPLVEVHGRVTRADTGEAFAGVVIDADAAGEPAGLAMTDREGVYRLRLPPGEYTLRPAGFQGVDAGEPAPVSVAAGAPVTRDLTVALLPLPAPLAKAVALYANLKTYQDRTTLRVVPLEPEGAPAIEHSLDVAIERPSRLALAVRSDPEHVRRLIIDGERVEVTGVSDPHPPEILTPGGLAPAFATLVGADGHPRTQSLAQTFALAFAEPHRLAMPGDVLTELRRGLSAVEVLGPGTLDGEPVTILELTRPAPFVLPGLPFGTDMAVPVGLSLWIDERGVIRRTDFEIDPAALGSGGRGDGRDRTVVFTSLHEGVVIDEPLPADLFEPPLEAE